MTHCIARIVKRQQWQLFQRVKMSLTSPEDLGKVAEKGTPSVVHDQKNHVFYSELESNDDQRKPRAVLEYQWIRKGVVDLYHTEVPPAFRGHGIAKHLAKAAFDYVKDTDGKMRLSCTYLQKYLNDNPLPEYTSRVVPLDSKDS